MSVCVLAGDDLEALAATVGAARGLGQVVVAVPRPLGETTRAALLPPIPAQRAPGASPSAVKVVELDLHCPVGQAWNVAMAAAEHDLCLLLHAGEALVAGRPGPDQAFTAATVVEQAEVFFGPQRLGTARVVDRRHCRFSGALRPVLEVMQDAVPAQATPTGGTVLADLGARIGPVEGAWLQFSARHLDVSSDPQDLVDLATMLAATGRPDAALMRLLAVNGALMGELGRRAARMLTALAVEHDRLTVAEIGAAEWQRLGGARGPALAHLGAALAACGHSAAAVSALDEALASGLTDEDGVGVDRRWVTGTRHTARMAKHDAARDLTRQLRGLQAMLDGDESALPLLRSWVKAGWPLAKLLEAFPKADRPTVVEWMVDLAVPLGVRPCLDLAESLWRVDKDRTVSLVQVAASLGSMPVEEALSWSRRFRKAGRGAYCPLTIVAAGAGVPPVSRVLAAAALIHDLDDERGRPLLQAAALKLHPAAVAGATQRLHERAPDLERMLAEV